MSLTKQELKHYYHLIRKEHGKEIEKAIIEKQAQKPLDILVYTHQLLLDHYPEIADNDYANAFDLSKCFFYDFSFLY